MALALAIWLQQMAELLLNNHATHGNSKTVRSPFDCTQRGKRHELARAADRQESPARAAINGLVGC